MKRRTRAVVGIGVIVTMVFIFLAPVVYYAPPTGIYSCPANGCRFPHLGSLTYWAFGIGGVLTYGCVVSGLCVSGNGYVIVG